MDLPQVSKPRINLSMVLRRFTLGPGGTGGAGSALSSSANSNLPQSPSLPPAGSLIQSAFFSASMSHGAGSPEVGRSVSVGQRIDDGREREQTPGTHSWSPAESHVATSLSGARSSRTHTPPHTPAHPGGLKFRMLHHCKNPVGLPGLLMTSWAQELPGRQRDGWGAPPNEPVQWNTP